VIAILILAAALIFPLPAVCLYGPLRDRICDRRLARRRQVERVVAPYRPIRIAEWTGQTWREVRPLAGAL
jgi:hypothetical protein